MLPGWRERVNILLRPHALCWRRCDWRGNVLAEEVVTCRGEAASEPWAPALQALTERLLTLEVRIRSATVILSNHFVRYAAVPWRGDLGNEEEYLAYVRHQFSRTYGEAATGWVLRASGCAPGRARLASAVDSGLIKGIEGAFASSTMRLHSIQPAFMQAFNYYQRSLKGATAWFAHAEQGKLSLGLIVNGEWRRTRGQLLRDDLGSELNDVLQQESLLTDSPSEDAPIYLYAPQHGEVRLSTGTRLNVRRLTPARSRALFAFVRQSSSLGGAAP